MALDRNVSDQDYERLSAYLDNALSASERADLEARLRSDTALRRELAALRQTVALVHGLPALKAPRDFTLDARLVRPRPRLLIFPTSAAFSALASAAAVFLLVVGLGLLLLSSNAALPPAGGASAGALANLPTSTLKTLDTSVAVTPPVTSGESSGGNSLSPEVPAQPSQSTVTIPTATTVEVTNQEAQAPVTGGAVPEPQPSLETGSANSAVASDMAAPTETKQQTDEAAQAQNPLPPIAGAPLPTLFPTSAPSLQVQAGSAAVATSVPAASVNRPSEESATVIANDALSLTQVFYSERATATDTPALQTASKAVATDTPVSMLFAATPEATAAVTDTPIVLSAAATPENTPAPEVTVEATTARDGTITRTDATAQPPISNAASGGSTFPAALVLIILGVLAFGLAVATTVVRRRNQ